MEGEFVMRKKNVLVAIDGSNNSMRALFAAKKQAAQTDSELTILTVIPPSFIPYFGKAGISQQDSKDLEIARQELLEKALEKLEDFEGEVQTKIRKGDPAEEVLEETETGKYDLIVMGSKGLGLFTRTLLGSVSNKVLNHTKTNVLIVK